MRTSGLWLYGIATRLLPETRFFGLKAWLLRRCGARVGKNVRISSSARFFGTGSLAIGDDVWIGSGNFIHSTHGASIVVGSCCDLGPDVMVLTGTHQVDSSGAHVAGRGMSADVEIGDGCWLGARSLILPGVKLPDKTLVAAGSVVAKSPIRKQMLVAGVPAIEKHALVARQ